MASSSSKSRRRAAGKVGPLLVGLIYGQHLDAADDEVRGGRRVGQLLLQPSPLFLAQDVALLVELVADTAAFRIVVARQVVTEVAGIEQDEAHRRGRGPQVIALIGPGVPAVGRIGGHVQKIEQQGAGGVAFGVFLAGVVGPVIVVVPGAEYGGAGGKIPVAGISAQGFVIGGHFGHVLRIGVDVIAHPDKGIRPESRDGGPERLRPVLPVTGAKSEHLAVGADAAGHASLVFLRGVGPEYHEDQE